MTNTTIQIPVELNIRIKRLAEKKSEELGLSSTLSQKKYLEILVLKAEAEEKEK
jgi:hypothetical protein